MAARWRPPRRRRQRRRGRCLAGRRLRRWLWRGARRASGAAALGGNMLQDRPCWPAVLQQAHMRACHMCHLASCQPTTRPLPVAYPACLARSSEALAWHSAPASPWRHLSGADTPRSAASWTSALSGPLALPQVCAVVGLCERGAWACRLPAGSPSATARQHGMLAARAQALLAVAAHHLSTYEPTQPNPTINRRRLSWRGWAQQTSSAWRPRRRSCRRARRRPCAWPAAAWPPHTTPAPATARLPPAAVPAQLPPAGPAATERCERCRRLPPRRRCSPRCTGPSAGAMQDRRLWPPHWHPVVQRLL